MLHPMLDDVGPTCCLRLNRPLVLKHYEMENFEWRFTCIKVQSISTAACVTASFFLFNAFTVFTPTFSRKLKQTKNTVKAGQTKTRVDESW
jgi:hypothetical protein